MVLYYLRQEGDTATVSELAEEIAAMENDVPVDELTSQQQKRVYVSLYQTHLPKLDQTGIVDYDADTGEVRLTSKAREVDTYLTQTTDSTYPWKVHYGALAVVSGIMILLWGLATPVLTSVQFVWLAAGITVAFAVSGGVHYWQYRQRQDDIPTELERNEP